MRDSGVFLDVDPLHKECLKFCFMPVLLNQLHSVAQLWNIRELRVDKNTVVVGGKQDVMFFLPEVYSTIEVAQEDVGACRDISFNNGIIFRDTFHQ